MDSEKRETAERKCYRILKNQIRTGELAAGTRLVESALSKQLEMSRTPIRKAVGMLAADGYATYEDYRGATVKDCIVTKEAYLEIIEVMFLFVKEAIGKICDKKLSIDSLSWRLDVSEGREAYHKSGLEGFTYEQTFIYTILQAIPNSQYNLIVKEFFLKLQEFSDQDVRSLIDRSLDRLIVNINQLFQALDTRSKQDAVAVLESMLNHQILNAFR